MTNEQIYQLSLTMINGVGDITARQLLQHFGSAEAVFTETPAALEKLPNIGRKLASAIKDKSVLLRAEKEAAFIEQHQLSFFFLTDQDYPARLRECPDAPVLFYYKGHKGALQAEHAISIVGTRHATDYGREMTERLLTDLSAMVPDLLVISGLAYGIDIAAHRSALQNNLSTIGVLAHGLDRIYPSVHRNVAIKMLDRGGLLTEFPMGTDPDRPNFVKRNRIVAGLSEATVVMESAEKGGSLITADMAFSYDREVCCFPGRATDEHSVGCNRLIRKNKASLILSADDLVYSMGWDVAKEGKRRPAAVQQELFPSGDDAVTQSIKALLSECKTLHLNELANRMNMPVYQISTILFELEMNGKIKALPGNMYKLCEP